MKKGTVFLLTALSMLVGAVLGFLCAPVKGGVSVGNSNCGNQYFDDPNEEAEEDVYGC